MNMKTNITILVVALLLGACTSNDEERVVAPVSIQLTASVATETLSPGDATAWSREAWKELTSRRATRGVQDNSLANNQKAYLWADKGSAGTYTYLKAWALTSNGSGGLTGSTKYYPSDGDGLTFRAMHGNFSTTPTEGSTAIGTFTHSVLANQSASGNLELSDLMYGEGSGSYQTVSSAPLNFTHKLSKIEVNLTAGPGMGASDMPNVVVKVKNVKPSITINAADGSLGSASGTAITVTARHTGNGIFEAVIPPQTAPTGVLTLTYSGVTVTVPNTVATFASNRRYVYNVTVKNVCKEMNPLYYVAEYNLSLATDNTTFSFNKTAGPSQGSLFLWLEPNETVANHNIMRTKWAAQTSGYNGYRIPTSTNRILEGESWHLPTQQEYLSIIPAYFTMDSQREIFENNNNFVPAGLYTEPQSVFGYNSATKTPTAYKSYWSSYSTANVRYAIRFLDTNYCSVWKYQFDKSGKKLVITSKIIERLASTDTSKLSSKLSEIMSAGYNWTTLDADEGEISRTFYACGFMDGQYKQSASGSIWNGERVYCWTSSVSGDYDIALKALDGYLSVDFHVYKDSFSVRLFRDN